MQAAKILAASPLSLRSPYLRWPERAFCRAVRLWRYVRSIVTWFLYVNGVLNIVRLARAAM